MTSKVDTVGAFCEHATNLNIAGKAGGPLAGLTFAVKDLIDVKGVVTGGGNPDWLRDHEPAKQHAWAVARLIESGATLTGKTITDELAFSLLGRNVHYGTPLNPVSPDRFPGGSSSGSVSAVTAAMTDFALGTDTGGSVRVPASYCGIYGMRPTHDRIPLDGVIDFAPSFDTVGWFARESQMLQRIGLVLFAAKEQPFQLKRVVRAEDAFERADTATAAVCDEILQRVAAIAGDMQSVRVCPESLDDWRQIFRVLRSVEAWRNKGPWIERTHPRFGGEIERNFAAAARTTQAEAEAMHPARKAVEARIEFLLGGDGMLALPTTPGPAPLLSASDSQLDSVRDDTQALTCIAGICGLPQISIPAGLVEGSPVGLSLIASRGKDEQLLALAVRLHASR